MNELRKCGEELEIKRKREEWAKSRGKGRD